MDDPILAIDMGTTSTKVLAVAPDGRVLHQHKRRYPLHSPSPGRAEQDPDVLRETVLECVRATLDDLGALPCGAAFGSALHGVLAVGADDRPLTSCWIWADRRAAAQAERLFADGHAAGLHTRTGTPVHAMAPLAKVLWLAEHEPELFARARRFVSIKEYVLHGLCGEWLVDESIASGTGLYALRARAWDPQALALAGLEPDRLSALVAVHHVVEGRREPLRGVPLVVGASDGALANLGAGATAPDRLAVTLGTSGAVRVVAGEPVADPEGRLFCYVVDETRYIVGGALDHVGRAIAWLRRLTGTEEKELIAQATKLPPGADGLLFLPMLGGERFAAWRPDATGVLLGVTHDHGPAHLARGILEAIASGVAVIAADLRRLCGTPFAEARLGGGLVEEPAVRQLLADVLQLRCAMPSSRESSGLGAARMGFEALGVPTDWEARAESVYDPDRSAGATYERIGSLHRALYLANEALMPEAARLRGARPG